MTLCPESYYWAGPHRILPNSVPPGADSRSLQGHWARWPALEGPSAQALVAAQGSYTGLWAADTWLKSQLCLSLRGGVHPFSITFHIFEMG